ncbi:hypothetical protein ACHAWF_006829 [Thalassiosira exigua]
MTLSLSVDVGTRPDGFHQRELKFHGWESICVHFHDFENISSRKQVCSRTFPCLGRRWFLSVYVWSGRDISACLHSKSENDNANVEFALGLKGAKAMDVSCTEPKRCAPALAEMGGTAGTVPVAGVNADVFRHALRYAYGGTIPDADMTARAKDIIVAADKFGMTNLKLEAEASYVRSTKLSLDNVVDNLLYADAKNCALLKEAAVDFLAEHGAEALKSVSLKDVPGGMFADLLTVMTRNRERGGKAGDGAVELSTMRVGELRQKLYEKGLEVDGSRETMIKMLKEHS